MPNYKNVDFQSVENNDNVDSFTPFWQTHVGVSCPPQVLGDTQEGLIRPG
jgi:hypothetical protein